MIPNFSSQWIRKKAKDVIGADHNHKVVLFVGRIEPLKGIDVLLYALKILMVRNHKLIACLWIVGGDSSQIDRLEKLVKILRISSSVKFVNQQPQEKLPYYYNASDLVIMPSHYESFGMVALEAMACGIPVITTNVTGVSNLINKQCEHLITSANNPLLLATQIEKLLLDDKFCKNISVKLMKTVKNLNW